jgi:hypothetical protein
MLPPDHYSAGESPPPGDPFHRQTWSGSSTWWMKEKWRQDAADSCLRSSHKSIPQIQPIMTWPITLNCLRWPLGRCTLQQCSLSVTERASYSTLKRQANAKVDSAVIPRLQEEPIGQQIHLSLHGLLPEPLQPSQPAVDLSGADQGYSEGGAKSLPPHALLL